MCQIWSVCRDILKNLSNIYDELIKYTSGSAYLNPFLLVITWNIGKKWVNLALKIFQLLYSVSS